MNLELEIRRLLVDASAGLYPDPSYIFSDTELPSNSAENFPQHDNYHWFWQQLEEKYDCPITKAQRETLKTVSDLIHYLKVRLPQVPR